MIKMEIKIRRATKNDIEAIADIKIEGWRNAYKGIIDDKFLESMNKTEEIEKQRKNISKECLIVAECNNKITGFCLYRDYNKNIELYPNADCEISSIYIKPSLKRNTIKGTIKRV